MSEQFFHEEQRFRQVWIWVLVIVVCGGLMAVFAWGLFQQLVLGKPWGDKGRTMSDTALVLTAVGIYAFCIFMIWLFSNMKLIVEVRRDGLLVNFRPLRRRLVKYQDIKSADAVQYHPLREYGGWGIRKGRGGWAYNVSGDRGVRLEMKDGSHLLIGSQREHELAEAIENMRRACLSAARVS
ncbi:MAG: hypothetical protein DRI34_07235 [Deltaproteobacteria bacterium]|nr:MAG: hypothetical protein DRI34_07235 [Deltaproteobacteria bacterium]